MKYLVVFKGDENCNAPPMMDLRIKHFRQQNPNGRGVSAHGGYTLIHNSVSGRFYSAKCRMDEQFSKRKGILVCIQKYLDSFNLEIDDYEFINGGIRVVVRTATGDRFAWL